MQRDELDEAVAHCGAVLRDDPDNAKALLRRAKAYLQMNNTDAAERDAARLTAQGADDAQVKALVQRLRRRKVRPSPAPSRRGGAGHAPVASERARPAR